MLPVIESKYLGDDGKNWKSQVITIDDHPNECPYCHRLINPELFASYVISLHPILASSSRVQNVYQCPNRACRLFFIAVYEPKERDDGNYYHYLSSIGPRSPKSSIELDTIKKLSPKYYEIYAQAQFAEELGLNDICGMGYRKALEFLIRDYIKLDVDEEKTRNQKLGACINNYIKDDKIKNAANRAAWLGNDETHYYRKFEYKDLEDLKILLRIAINFIDSSLALEKYTTEMPKNS